MHMTARVTLPMLALAAAMFGCSSKPEVPPIAGWEPFSDQFFRAHFTAPSGWQVQKEPSRAVFTSSLTAQEKFFDPRSKSEGGSQLIVAGDKTDSLRSLDDVYAEYKQGLVESGFQIMSETDITVDSTTFKQIEYGGKFDANTTLRAVRAIAYKDTTTYFVHYGGFNEFYEPWKPAYDSVIATLMLPRPIVVRKDVDPSIPVEQTSRFSNEFAEFVYPENFSTSIDKPGAGVEYAMTMMGYRTDGYVKLDIRPAQGLTVDKVVEQNQKNFRNASSSTNAKVGADDAKLVTWSPTRGVEGRVYFVVKNDKFYRVIVVYPSSLKKEFVTAFDRTIASMKLK
jgi:hypothetical protein